MTAESVSMIDAVYKIVPAELWREAERNGRFDGAPVDLADGYIHFSTAAQAPETAAKHFGGQRGLTLVAVEAAALGEALKWEVSRGGALFPHLYGPLPLSAVIWTKPLPLGDDGAHVFPQTMTGSRGTKIDRPYCTADALWRAAKPAINRIPPEISNQFALTYLRASLLKYKKASDPKLKVKAFGFDFSNPVGFAAGLDKNAIAFDGALNSGLGFTEVGTVTPKPQYGNPRPRVFRLIEDQAVINRMGFPNDGIEKVAERLLKRKSKSGIIAVNIGANAASSDKISDYVKCINRISTLADMFVINVSSPNTKGLRDLQSGDILRALLSRVCEARDAQTIGARRLPLLLKVAPDLSLNELDELCAVSIDKGIDGIVLSNTTVARPRLISALHTQAGGLSGDPLFRKSTWMLAQAYLRVGSQIPLVGVGGINSGDDALQKICAGATLIELYSSLVYNGFWWLDALFERLISEVEQKRATGIGDLVGTRAAEIAAAGPGD